MNAKKAKAVRKVLNMFLGGWRTGNGKMAYKAFKKAASKRQRGLI